MWGDFNNSVVLDDHHKNKSFTIYYTILKKMD